MDREREGGGEGHRLPTIFGLQVALSEKGILAKVVIIHSLKHSLDLI